MNNIVAKTMKAGTAALALVIAAGCQSSKALDEVRALAQSADQKAASAQSSADQARAAAQAADRKADVAKSAADAAQSTANQALQAAQAAQAGVDASNEKIDRMFKKTVAK
jgi:hypothetical protein